MGIQQPSVDLAIYVNSSKRTMGYVSIWKCEEQKPMRLVSALMFVIKIWIVF
jgi:hypothetical protein